MYISLSIYIYIHVCINLPDTSMPPWHSPHLDSNKNAVGCTTSVVFHFAPQHFPIDNSRCHGAVERTPWACRRQPDWNGNLLPGRSETRHGTSVRRHRWHQRKIWCLDVSELLILVGLLWNRVAEHVLWHHCEVYAYVDQFSYTYVFQMYSNMPQAVHV